jgi:hypothetical protein
MTNERSEQLEAIRRELEKQDEAWKRLQAVAARLGDVEIEVPREVLEKVVGPTHEPAAPMMGVRV